MKLIAVCLALVVVAVSAADWAVIVAGSNSYGNYRHQADACHAYQILHKNGIPDEHIITFMYDDIASDPSNPFPGKIFNKPTDKGTAGVDVYANVHKDYTGADVTPEHFLAVLTGNASAVPKGKKVLQSTKNDRVFVFFSDHGGPGLIAFPSSYLYATDLIPALKTMYTNKMYSRMVFYLEACESGSMFDKLLPTSWGIYATTASNPGESSWGDYCPPNDMVDGKEINSCLGDLYSTNWMENADQVGMNETLEAQFNVIKKETTQSEVMQYGDQSWTSERIGDYLGDTVSLSSERSSAQGSSSKVAARDIPVHLAYYRYVRAAKFSDESKQALTSLRAILDARELAETRFTRLSEILYGTLNKRQANRTVRNVSDYFANPETPIISTQCVKSAVNALHANGCGYDDYSIQFHKVIVNACRQYDSEDAATQTVMSAINVVCPAK